jgi:ribosome-binding factor A
MKSSRRSERVGGMLRDEISRAVHRVVQDPRIRGVTFTGVKLSSDLRHARVYYSVLGDRKRQEQVREGLLSARGVIKREVGRHLQLRYVPDMEFFFDASLGHAEQIENLLRQIEDPET